MPGVESAIDQALLMIRHVRDAFDSRIDKAKDKADKATDAVTAAHEEMVELTRQKLELLGGTTSQGRAVRRMERVRDDDQLETITEKIIEARVKHKEMKMEEKLAKDELDQEWERLYEWGTVYPHQIKETLMEHAQNIMKPVAEYYKAQFLDPTGDCYPMRVVAEGAQIFNHIFLARQSSADVVTVVYDLADKLKTFKF